MKYLKQFAADVLKDFKRLFKRDNLEEVRNKNAARWVNLDLETSSAVKKSKAYKPEKYVKIASHITEGSTVLDIGAGYLPLKAHLPKNCKYVPADVVKRSDDCLVLDLNKKEFPEQHFDVIVLVGVLEYLDDPLWVLEKARKHCNKLIVSYNLHKKLNHVSLIERREHGLLNDYTKSDILQMISKAGWTDLHEDSLLVTSRMETPLFVLKTKLSQFLAILFSCELFEFIAPVVEFAAI